MQVGHSPTRRVVVRGVAVYKILTVLTLVAALVILHVLRPDLSPAKRHISQYARGDYSELFVAGLFVLSSGTIALAGVLRRAVRWSWMSQVGIALLSVYGVGILLVGGFFTDGGTGGRHTVQGLIHAWSAVGAGLALIGAWLFLTLAFHGDRRWRPLVVLSWVLLVVVALTGFGLVVFTKSDVVGIIQRVCVGVILFWLTAVAVRVFQLGDRRESEQRAVLAREASRLPS